MCEAVLVNGRPLTFVAVSSRTTVISMTICWSAGMSTPTEGSSMTRLVGVPVLTGVQGAEPETSRTARKRRSASESPSVSPSASISPSSSESASASPSAAPTVPSCRIYSIPAEARVFAIYGEIRVMPIQSETRVMPVPCVG